MNRRGLILGLSALVAAPAIIRIPGLLMPIKPSSLVLLRITTQNTIGSIKIGEHAASDAFDFAGTPAEFLFSGSASREGAIVSDVLPFTLDETKTYIILAKTQPEQEK